MADQLRVEVRPNGDVVTFRLAGEVDLASIGTLRCCLDDVDSAWRVVVIDAADLTFIDSIGIAALAGAHLALQEDGRELRIENAAPAVHRVLELTGMTEVFTVVPPPERSLQTRVAGYEQHPGPLEQLA